MTLSMGQCDLSRRMPEALHFHHSFKGTMGHVKDNAGTSALAGASPSDYFDVQWVSC